MEKELKFEYNLFEQLRKLRELKSKIFIKSIFNQEKVKLTSIISVREDYIVDESNEIYPFGTFTIQI